jgi:hypothetical protein
MEIVNRIRKVLLAEEREAAITDQDLLAAYRTARAIEQPTAEDQEALRLVADRLGKTPADVAADREVIARARKLRERVGRKPSREAMNLAERQWNAACEATGRAKAKEIAALEICGRLLFDQDVGETARRELAALEREHPDLLPAADATAAD